MHWLHGAPRGSLRRCALFLATPRLHASAHHGAPSCPQVRPLPRKAAPRARTRVERTPHPETLANGLDAEVHHWRPVCAHHGACDRGLRVPPMAWRRAGPVLACTCPSRRPGSPFTFGRLHARAHLGAWARRVHLGAEMCVCNPPTAGAVPGERRTELAPFRDERRAGRAPFRAGLESSRPPLGRLHLESSLSGDCISSRPVFEIASRVVPVLAPRTCSHVGMTCTLHTTIPVGLVAVRQPLPSDWLRFVNLSHRDSIVSVWRSPSHKCL